MYISTHLLYEYPQYNMRILIYEMSATFFKYACV